MARRDPERTGRTGARRAGLAVALVLAAWGCASNPAPPGWLPTADEATRSAYGGWIAIDEVHVDSNGKERVVRVEGEFLSAGPDTTVRVLTAQGVRIVFPSRIRRAELYGFDVKQTIGVWTAPGFLFTASNGWIAAITAPVWIFTGAMSSSASWNAARTSTPKQSWQDMSLYARFPQGWPEGLAADSIRADERWPEMERLVREAPERGSTGSEPRQP
jgi:hypothetical protein